MPNDKKADRWFGSYHDGLAQAKDDTRARKNQMYT